ncbi:alpha/beta hydrolase [Clostridium grantii]|uniref:Acetyl esterase/lipase n=1 Tax=Clostridium grantii DSM 8605 TaxID=1121316 RepID=A0A1M5UKN3_9CLOT|nr:alpha/beta hydrolase [Clostridium grantii]SHH63243.1 Acetyl esterase/lipase [Clostridium grantii DSM 8605]
MKITVKSIIATMLITSLFTGCSSNEANNTTTEATAETSSTEMQKPTGGGLGGSSVDTSAITNQYLDIAYATVSESQKLDIYLPNEGEEPFPVIIAIHGGAFKMGNRTGGGLTAMLEGVNHGYAVVCVDYRLSGEAIFPAAVNDVKAAIRYIYSHASEYNLNPDKIATWGDSAGGNLASIAGTTSGTNDLYDSSLGMENVSDKITAVVDWFGPLDFLSMDQQFQDSGIMPVFGLTSSESSPESSYIGQLITDAPELTEQANPETYISEDDPAFLIQHGTADGNVPTQQSINFSDALVKVIGEDKVQLTLLEGVAHGGEAFESESNLELVFEFLDKYMK